MQAPVNAVTEVKLFQPSTYNYLHQKFFSIQSLLELNKGMQA